MNRWLRIGIALVVLLGFAYAGQRWSRSFEHLEAEVGVVDALGEPVPGLRPALVDTGAGVGLLLLGSWLVGWLVAPTGLPRVSGFLVFGVLCGPSVLGVISSAEMDYLVLVNDLAIALIALLAGAEIKVEFLRKSLRRIASVTLIEMGAVLVGVTGVALLVVPRAGLAEGMGPVFLVSLLIGTVLITNSPAVLLAVVTELRSRGDMTQLSLAVTVCKDLLLVILFTVVLAVVATGLRSGGEGGGAETGGEVAAASVESGSPDGGDGVGGGEAGESREDGASEGEGKAKGNAELIAYLAQHLLGSIIAGVVAGLCMAWYLHRVDAHLPVFLVFACFGIALGSEALHLEPLIVAVVAGMLLQNVWGERLEGFFETVEDMSTPVYCVFFAVTGAKVDLAQAGAMAHWAVVLVAVRAFFVWAGTTLAARLTGVEGLTRRWLWTAFVPQAGISMALVLIVADQLEGIAGAEGLFTLLIGVIAINLLGGPLVLSVGLRRAGEAGGADREDEGPDEGGGDGEGEGAKEG